jgi:uncharacterized protein (TIGR02145 family)
MIMKKKSTTIYLLIILLTGLLNLQFLCLEEPNEEPTCVITYPTSNNLQIEKGETVTINAEAEDSDGTITKVEFFIDNILVATVTIKPYTYDWNTSSEDPGDHTIRVTATDDGDASAHAEISVTIVLPSLPPVAQFEASPLNGTSPLEVSFTDLSQNDPQSWLWDFGDGSSSTEQNPVHIYNAPATYTVSLTATNPQGSDTETKNGYVVVTSGGGSGFPCPGIETVTYGEQVYHTVLIGEQCWLKENLNVGKKISSNNPMSDDGEIEKYCYGNIDANCDTYGALYQWREAMLYSVTEGARGICPEGWHIPTNVEWNTLEGTTDSQFGPGDEIWNGIFWRGFDVGTNLKSTSGWDGDGNGSDLSGFTTFPAGYHRLYDSGLGSEAYIWTSTSDNGGATAYYRRLNSTQANVYRYAENPNYGHSVRCIQDGN